MAPPCVLQLTQTLHVEADSITLAVLRDHRSSASGHQSEVLGAAAAGARAAARAVHALHALPLSTVPREERVAAHSRIAAAKRATGSPQSCVYNEPDWSDGELDQIVLSCVAVRASSEGSSELLDPLGTALNVTGAGFTMVGVSVFGCQDTGMSLHGSEALIVVRRQPNVSVWLTCRASNGTAWLLKLPPPDG